MRARIVALSWSGLRVAGIAAEPGCHPKTVRWWLHRFNELGPEGLEDRPITRSAAPAHRVRAVADHRAGQAGTARTSGPAGGRGTRPCRRDGPARMDAGRA
ncbi:helix-turn-helix domain-containing protein, partial [Kitasatospora sp. NPDC058406]|uniref:helix-turn-helix domain-containing protein n=1 Tax=Kitasatospora sp. NPDC058406 TaxID=3346483 RepID=UPI00364E2A03